MFRSHVLMCAGTGCTSSGSAQVAQALEQALEEKGLEKKLR